MSPLDRLDHRDAEYLPRRTLVYDMARLELAWRLFVDALLSPFRRILMSVRTHRDEHSWKHELHELERAWGIKIVPLLLLALVLTVAGILLLVSALGS